MSTVLAPTIRRRSSSSTICPGIACPRPAHIRANPHRRRPGTPARPAAPTPAQPLPFRFDRSLGMIVNLMRVTPATQIYCLTLGGFNMHRAQAAQHVKRFIPCQNSAQQNLESHGLPDRVMTMAWSEFGHQPVENVVRGTDHGTTGPVLLLGSRVKGGIMGGAMTATPESSAATDFWRIYATLLGTGSSVLPMPCLTALGTNCRWSETVRLTCRCRGPGSRVW